LLFALRRQRERQTGEGVRRCSGGTVLCCSRCVAADILFLMRKSFLFFSLSARMARLKTAAGQQQTK
jgi:hypothetical protein